MAEEPIFEQIKKVNEIGQEYLLASFCNAAVTSLCTPFYFQMHYSAFAA